MDYRSPMTRLPLDVPGEQALSLVPSGLQLAQPGEPAPQDWQAGTAMIAEWLGIDITFVPAAPLHAPVFAPWIGWNPAAFQHGGVPGLPMADYVASYCIDHARAALARHDGIDLVLLSPHPAQCAPEEERGAPLPRAGLLTAMINAARAEGRETIAIIVHARQRDMITAMNEAPGTDVLMIEDALPALMAGRSPWDAIIAMPDLRSTIFTVLSHAGSLPKAWPMVWMGRGLQLVTSEAAGARAGCLPLDAQGLIHALSLTLHHMGAPRAAWRLHDAWARLRDSGVTTAGRGPDAPYVSVVPDAEFLSMLQRDAAASRRPQKSWRAIENQINTPRGSQIPVLRVIPSHLSISAT